MSDEIRDSDGLYYPYINIRDENWLKINLLYFPHIRRMVPAAYETNPTNFMKKLANTLGARNEPLLGAYSLRSFEADQAVNRLIIRLLDDVRRDQEFSKRFSREAACRAYNSDELFQVHRGKAPGAFWDELNKLGLMWRGRYRKVGSIELDDQWIALHPLLGEAFMATIAIAAAKDNGMEIITDTPGCHQAVASYSEEVVYDMLIKQRSNQKGPLRVIKEVISGAKGRDNPQKEMTLRAAHIVIASNFDVSALSVDDLAGISKNREALFDFRRHLTRKIGEIPSMTSEAEREWRLQAVAEDVVNDWRKTVPTFSRFARRFFGLGLLDKSERAMTDLAKALIPGSLTGAAFVHGPLTGVPVAAAKLASSATLLGAPVIAAGPGLAVAVAVYGIKTWQGLKDEHSSSPLRYLSLLKKAGATLLMSVPPADYEVYAR